MATLQEIVEGIYLESQSIDSIFRNKERYLMYGYAKQGLKKLNLTFAQGLKGMNFHVPASCTAYKPNDFQSFVRAYLINCDGRKIEIKRNNNIPEKIYHYLVNCDGSLISDDCENEVTDDCLVCNTPKTTYGCQCSPMCGGQPCLPTEIAQLVSDLTTYKDSWIKENPEYFEFSADLEEMAVVIEYISNQTSGVPECEIYVADDMEDALTYFIKFKLLENGENTMNQAQSFYRKYKASRDKALADSNALTVEDLQRVMLFR